MVPENTNPPSKPLQPSDLTLDRSWRALKPGNYKPRTDLTQYKHPLIEDLDQHKSAIPVGVADERSAVFIYPQGTIEVIGKVYCWNKLVKPGIYSPFEKLRYLAGNEIILNRDENSVQFHHASYDKFTIPANPFLTKEVFNNNEVLQYHFVSFDDQIISSTGDKVYPIPILNGRLTIYPDGTFKTQGIVVESKENRYIDDYGYLADYDNYSAVESYYDGITKDDLNPKNVYKIISENSDGSITYGPIESNKNIKRSRWIPLPEGIIPVNDGVVSITSDGEVELSGLVITKYGHRIVQRRFKAKDFKANSLNEQWVDKSTVYNPVGYSLHQDKFQSVVLDIVSNDDIIDTYRYHYYPESYTVNKLENDTQLIYRAMPGWDTFTTATPVKGSLAFLKEQIESYPENSSVDFTYYPWVNEFRVTIGGVYRYPFVRYNPEGKISSYVSIDHYPLQWHFNDITNVEYHVNYFTHEDIDGNELELADEQPNYLTYPKYQNVEYLFPLNTKNKNKFIPYNGGKIWFTKNDQNQIMVHVQGSVIWQRGERYYRIGLEDFANKKNLNKVYTCIYDDSWPDIVEDEKGNIVSLFTVNGYFTDEPVFIKSKHTLDKKSIGNELTSIRTWKRQEEGLFQLVERDLTYYLTDYEKTLINNIHGQYRSFKIDENEVKIEEYHNYYLNVPYTAEQTGLILDYQAIRFNDVLPNWFNPSYFTIDNYSDIGNNRNLSFERGKHQLVPYRPIQLYLTPNNFEHKPKYKITLQPNQAYTLSHHYHVKDYVMQRIVNDGTTVKANIDALTYKDKVIYLDNKSQEAIKEDNNYPVQQLAYLNRTLLTLPKNWATEERGLTIPGHATTRNTLILYRYFNDIKLISGSVTSDENGDFNIPAPELTVKRGYIEVWLDDPFGVNKLGIYDTSYYFIDLRNQNVLEEITINDSENIDQLTTRITGKADPEATVTISINLVDQGVTLPVDPEGNWSWDCDLSQVPIGAVITATESKEDFPSQSAEAIVKKHLWKNGEFITPLQLFGDPMYMIPYNIRHKDNQDNVPNHIDSALTINPMNQTYTIHGVILSMDGNTIYPEGTYDIGHKPQAYTSKMITQDYVTSKVIQYTRIHPTEPNVYRIGTTYKGSKNDPIKLPNTMVEVGQDESWIYPRSWLTEWNNLSTHADKRDLPYMQLLINWFGARDIVSLMKTVRKEGSITRFQNRIVFDEYLRFETTMHDQLYFVQRAPTAQENNEYFGYRKDGYNALEFYQTLLLDQNQHLVTPWWLLPNKIGQPEGVTDPVIYLRKLPDHQSYTHPLNWKVKAIASSVEDRAYTFEGNEWVVPTQFKDTYSMTLYHIHNWDKIVSYSDYHNEPYLIHYLESYAYTLDKNYDQMETPMKDSVKQHWIDKGFDPNMFVFDHRKTKGTRVEFHKNGKTMNHYGRTKIGGRYTKNIDQLNIKHKSEIQFINSCPNAYLPHEDKGLVNLTDNDEIVINGIVYGLDCYQGEIRDRELLPEQLEPRILKVSSLHSDSANQDWDWVTNENQYLEIEIGNVDSSIFKRNFKINLSVSTTKESPYIKPWRETITFNQDGFVDIHAPVNTVFDNDTKTLIIRTIPSNQRTVPVHGEYNHSSENIDRYFELGVSDEDRSSLEDNTLTTSITLTTQDSSSEPHVIDSFIIKNQFHMVKPIKIKFNEMIDGYESYITDPKGEISGSNMYEPRTFLVEIVGGSLIDLAKIQLELQVTYKWNSHERIRPNDPASPLKDIIKVHKYPFKIDLNNANAEVLLNEPDRALVRINRFSLRDNVWGDKKNDPWLIVPPMHLIREMYYNLNEQYGDMPLIGELYRLNFLYTVNRENTPEDLRHRIFTRNELYSSNEYSFTFITGSFNGNGKSLERVFGTNNIEGHFEILDSNKIEGDNNPRHPNYPYGWRDIKFVIKEFPRIINKDLINYNLHSVYYNYIHFSEAEGIVYDTLIKKDEFFSIEIDENWTATIKARIVANGNTNYPLPRRRLTDGGKVWTNNPTYQTAEHYIELVIPGYDKIRLSGMADYYHFYHLPSGNGSINKWIVEDLDTKPKNVEVFSHLREMSIDIEEVPVEFFDNDERTNDLNMSVVYEMYLDNDDEHPLFTKTWEYLRSTAVTSHVERINNDLVKFRWHLGQVGQYTPLANTDGYLSNSPEIVYQFSHIKEIAPYVNKTIHHVLKLNVGNHTHVIDLHGRVEYNGSNVIVSIEQPNPNSYDNKLYSKADYRYTFKNVKLEEIGKYEFTILSGRGYIERDGRLSHIVNGNKSYIGDAHKYTYTININDPSVTIEKNDPGTKTIVLLVRGLSRQHPFLAKYKDDPWLIMPRMEESDTAIYYQLNNEKPLLTL